MKRYLIPLILLPLFMAADAPKKATPPQSIIDALAACEADRQAIGAADASIAAAQAQLNAATDAKGKATLAAASDYASFLTLWNSLYPAPTPPVPTPPTPVPPTPIPPTPIPPVPVNVKLRVVALYATDGSLTEAQREMIASEQPGSLRAWLQANCLSATDGTVEKRFWAAGMVSTDVADSASRFRPLVEAAGGKLAIVAQAGEGGPITRLEFPTDAATAIAALNKIANPAGRSLHVIDETNWRQLVGVRATGYIKGTVPKGMATFRSVYPLIPRSQWSALIAQGKGTFLGDLMRKQGIPVKDQDGLGYCWVYASTECVEAVRALQGQPFVELSPESVGGPLTGWHNQGGNGLDALDQLTKAGACSVSFMDSANSLSQRRWKTGWQADALNHRITDAWASIDDGNFDAVMTAALLRLPVSIGLDWWGHQVLITEPVDIGGGRFGLGFRNSWGKTYGDDGYDTLDESKAKPDGSFAEVSAGTSDRELNATRRGTVVDLVRLRQESVRKIIRQYEAKPVPATCPSGCQNCPKTLPVFQNAQ